MNADWKPCLLIVLRDGTRILADTMQQAELDYKDRLGSAPKYERVKRTWVDGVCTIQFDNGEVSTLMDLNKHELKPDKEAIRAAFKENPRKTVRIKNLP
jgi:outer membrane cobalamin receptor